MKLVSDVMTRGVRTLAPTDNVVLAAQAMDELNIGSIPVCDGERLVGIVTDRDIVTRAVAQDCSLGKTALSDVMSTDIRWASESDPADEALEHMAHAQIRRVPVVDRDKRLVGILSLGDVAAKESSSAGAVADSLADISTPARPDRSGQSKASGPAGGGAEGAGAERH